MSPPGWCGMPCSATRWSAARSPSPNASSGALCRERSASSETWPSNSGSVAMVSEYATRAASSPPGGVLPPGLRMERNEELDGEALFGDAAGQGSGAMSRDTRAGHVDAGQRGLTSLAGHIRAVAIDATIQPSLSDGVMDLQIPIRRATFVETVEPRAKVLQVGVVVLVPTKRCGGVGEVWQPTAAHAATHGLDDSTLRIARKAPGDAPWDEQEFVFHLHLSNSMRLHLKSPPRLCRAGSKSTSGSRWRLMRQTGPTIRRRT